MYTTKMLIIAALAAYPAVLGAQTMPSSSTTTHSTPIGPVTHSTSTTPMANGTYTTHTVSPGNGSSPSIYVGTVTSDPYPNKSPSTTVPTVGLTIPIEAEPK